MPYLLPRLVLALMCFCTCAAWAASPAPADAIVLEDASPSFSVTTDIQSWLDGEAKADMGLASTFPQLFSTVPALQRHLLTERNTLWVKLHLVRAVGNTSAWVLNIPLPFVDSVTLYQRNGAAGWTAQTAGDKLPQSAWNKSGLYPEFDLRLPAGVPQEIYLQVRNFKHTSLPIRVATLQARETQRLLEMATLGLMLGTLLTLCLLSLVRYLEHRNRSDVWASLYGLLILLTVAQINGVLNLFVWPGLPEWGNYASSVLPVVAIGAALLFVRNLYTLSTHYHRYDVFLGATGWATIASVLSYMALERATADWVTALLMLFTTSVGLAATFLSWRGKSPIWRWLMLAYVPQYLGLMRLMAEALGLVPTLWEMRYLTSLSVAASVPLLIYALSRTTHDRKELKNRANLLPTQDALTGLLTPQAFHTQLESAYARAVSEREPIALVLVKITNHEHLRQSLGDTVAEQCLLRSVVKLHRILRDVDPAGRIGTAHFALLLEGMTTRQALTERMVQLVASGLIPLPGLTPPVHLQFQVACVLLHENPQAPESALAQLDSLLNSMSPHTRRPIRFLEPVPTQAAPLQREAAPA